MPTLLSVIAEHPDIPPQRVAAAARHDWGVEVSSVEHAPVDSAGWHWVLGDDDGPQWFAALDPVRTSEQRRARLASLESAVQVSRGLSFVVAPVQTRDARVAVDLAPGLLLTLSPHVEGAVADQGPPADDEERAVLARLLGLLHSRPRPRRLPLWRPVLDGLSDARRDDLLRRLDLEDWSGGPWSVPVGRLVAETGSAIRLSVRRLTLLSAAVTGSVERWVPTRGAPRRGDLVHTPDGPRLVGWGGLALAPRERDLVEVLGGTEGAEPWFSYVEGGGRPDPLSPDTRELFTLQRHLTRVADHVARFSRPHEDTADDRRCFGELERDLAALLDLRA